MQKIESKIGIKRIEEIEQSPELLTGQVHTVQMRCNGKQKCPYGDECPVSEPPVGKKCALELYQQHNMYLQLIDKFNAHNNETLKQLIRSLVSVEIQLARQNAIIQSEGFEQYIVTESEDGKKTVQKKLHNVTVLIDQLENRKVKILKQIQDEIQHSNATAIAGDLAQLFEYLKK